MSYCTYIIYSETIESYYIGMTSNTDERIRKHNGKSKGFTNRANDWKFVYSKSFSDKASALKHEKQIKSWKSKDRIKRFLNSSDELV